ncbi:MAG TPA: tyrosine-type recombinase/integrase [Streptosporangiaceae bacterium]|nr:tyrosine-type recombinase/integrase [Streptosporangiaceae bacterium]
MRTRRGNLESWTSSEPNARGYYEAKVWMGYKGDGKPDRRHIQRKSLAAVRREVRRLERMRDTGAVGRPGKAPTVEEMLTRHLTVVLPQRGRAPRTIADYWSKCRNDIFPRWGGQRIDRLRPEHIEDGLAAMLAEGHAPAHVRKVLAILSSAYEVQAKRAAAFGMPGGTTMTNPCRFVEPPELGEANRKSLTLKQARIVLEAARGRGSFARWAAGLSLGLRQGEALGLRWRSCDIDVPDGEPGVMRVWAQLQRLTWEHGCDDPHGCGRKYHKTRPCPAKCSRHARACPPPCPDDCTDHARHCPRRKLPRGSIRLNGALVLRETVKEKRRKTIPVPPEVCEILRAHRSAQFEQRMLAASEWTDHDLVFTQWNGAPVDPRRDWADWGAVIKAAGIPHAGVHAGRHANASIHIEIGTVVTAVQELLGHADARTTAGYVHTSSPATRAAAKAMGRALFGEDE